jgi:tRNA splicing endonuclease
METIEMKSTTKSWIPTSRDDSFNNQLIEAYMTGKKEGIEQQQKLVNAKVVENINKTGCITQYLMDTLRENQFHPVDAYLRVQSLAQFDVMITVPEDEYLQTEFLEMMDVISEIENKSKEELYEVFISFCSINECFDERLVVSDAYSLKLMKR